MLRKMVQAAGESAESLESIKSMESSVYIEDTVLLFQVVKQFLAQGDFVGDLALGENRCEPLPQFPQPHTKIFRPPSR